MSLFIEEKKNGSVLPYQGSFALLISRSFLALNVSLQYVPVYGHLRKKKKKINILIHLFSVFDKPCWNRKKKFE